MDVNLYILISIILTVTILLSDRKSYKRYIKKDFWTEIENISENRIIQKLIIDEQKNKLSIIKKITKRFKVVISKSGVPKLNFNRLQVMSILSSFSVVALQILIYLCSIFNIILHRSRLEVLAQNMGPNILQIPSFHIPQILVIGISSYFIPYVFFKLYGIFREKKAQREVMLLQTYTLMMLGTGKSIKYILEILLSRSNIYKESFRKCLHEYSLDPKKALDSMKDEISISGFTSMINALEKSLFYDREMAEIYLKNSRRLENNIKKINLQKSNKNKQMAGAILLILPLSACCIVGGYPWLILILKMMLNLNGM